MTKRKKDDWQTDARGRYSRRVGMSYKDHGKPVSLNSLGDRKPDRHMFHFGTDLAKARARLMRVEELWAHVVDLCSQPPEDAYRPLTVESDKRVPVWGGALWIAKELAAGKVQVVVERYDGETEGSYATKIHQLASTYPCVVFVPEAQEAFNAGTDFMRRAADHQLRQIHKENPNVLPTTSATLHEALDAYIAFIKRDAVTLTDEGLVLTSFGALKIGQVNRLKAHHSDFPLSSLDLDKCQGLIDHWRNRPASDDKRNKKPRILAYRSCQNHISELRRFFKWLHRTKEFDWRKPEDFEDLVTRVKDITDERTSIAHETQVRVYTPSELAILYKCR